MKKIILALFFCQSGYAQITPTVYYIGNEGVLIESGSSKIMIDGLHTFYGDAYMFPDQSIVDQQMNGEGIFQNIDLLLVSHVHGDHFNASMVAEFLTNHKETILVSSQQVEDSVLKYVDQSVRPRIKSFDLDAITKSFIVDDIRLTLFNLPHSSQRFSWIQNLGNLVEVNGISYLHTGDAAMTASWLENIKLQDYDVDVALMPFWYVLDKSGADVIKKYVNPDHYIALHIPPPPNNMEPFAPALKNWPNLIWFSKKGDKKELE